MTADQAKELLKSLGYTVSKPRTPKSEFFWGDGSKTDVKPARAKIVPSTARFEDGTIIKGQIVYDGVTKQYRLGPFARACCDRWRYRKRVQAILRYRSPTAKLDIDYLAVPRFATIEIGEWSIDTAETNEKTYDYRGASHNRYAVAALGLKKAA